MSRCCCCCCSIWKNMPMIRIQKNRRLKYQRCSKNHLIISSRSESFRRQSMQKEIAFHFQFLSSVSSRQTSHHKSKVIYMFEFHLMVVWAISHRQTICEIPIHTRSETTVNCQSPLSTCLCVCVSLKCSYMYGVKYGSLYRSLLSIQPNHRILARP